MSKIPQLGVYILLGEAKQTRKRISKHERERDKKRQREDRNTFFSYILSRLICTILKNKFLENVLLFYIFEGKIT